VNVNGRVNENAHVNANAVGNANVNASVNFENVQRVRVHSPKHSHLYGP
jgi:hypothetical protein